MPGVRDSVVHGTSGLLVRSEDELAEQWVALASDTARRDLLGRGAQRVAGRYSWSKTVDAFLQVAEEAVEQRHPLPLAPRVVVPRPRLGRRPALSGSRPQVTVVVPAFNEAERLQRSLPQLTSVLAQLDSELIVVDDGSTDDTASAATSLLRAQMQHTVVRLGRHEGKGAAVRAGVARARGRSIVFMDADLATDLSHLPDVLAALEQNHVAVGSRAADGAATTGATMAQVWLGRTFNRLARDATGLTVSDFQCGFKAFRAPAAKLLFHLSQLNGFAFDVEILMLASQIGYRISEVPVRWTAVPAVTSDRRGRARQASTSSGRVRGGRSEGCLLPSRRRVTARRPNPRWWTLWAPFGTPGSWCPGITVPSACCRSSGLKQPKKLRTASNAIAPTSSCTPRRSRRVSFLDRLPPSLRTALTAA